MKKSLFSFAFAVCTLSALAVNAQDHVLSASAASGLVGSSVDVTVTYNNNSVDNIIQGYNYGVCTADETIAIATAHVTGADGTGTGFAAFNVTPGGATAGVILSFGGDVVFNPGESGELSIISYDVLAEGTTALDFCGTLGSPVVDLGVADTGAVGFPVDTNPGSVTGQAAPPPYILEAPTATVSYDGNTGTGSFDANFSIGENPNNATGAATSGFSMSVASDATLVQPTMINLDLLTAALGQPAGFSGPQILADNSGWTLGIIHDFGGAVSPDLTNGQLDLVVVSYAVTAPVAPTPDSVATLSFVTLGTPEVPNDVTIGTTGQDLILNDGAITLQALVDLSFIRGDCNQDLLVNIADGISILSNLFGTGTTGGCAEACDANADGMFDSSDAIFVFNYRFLGGPMPSAPFPDCGVVAGADCAASACP